MDKKTAVFIAIGFECVGLVTAFVLLGRWLDERYGWKGMGVAGGAIFGVVSWMFHLIILLRRNAEEPDPSEKK